MPLRDIVTIALRLFSLMWLVQGFTEFAAIVAAASPVQPLSLNYWNFAVPALLVVLAMLTWLFAPAIARVVTPQPQFSVTLGGLTRVDLYCFAFVFLGVYFILSSIGNVLNELHGYILLAKVVPETDPMRRTSFYHLTQALITLVAGGLSVALSSRLSRKLALAQANDQAT